MKVWDYLVMPLKGFFRGIHSYRFFNALLKSNDAKVLKMIKTRRNLFNLEEVHTGLSPLHVLIRENKEDLLKEFFARKEVKNYVNSQENTLKWAPIHFAANIGSVPILEQISTKTSNFSIKTLEGTSAIHIASGKGNQSFLAKLLELGVHVDEKDLNDWTALHYSASQNFLEISEFLISKGAKTSLCDKNHLTPLMAAILHGSTESVKFLYKFVDGHKSLSPLKLIHFACSLSTPEVLEWLHLQGEDLWQFDNSV